MQYNLGMLKKNVIKGLELKTTNPAKSQARLSSHKVVVLPGVSFSLPLVPSIFSQHILFSGGIGSGKTNAINHIVKQLIEKRTANDVVIIFN